MRANDCSRRVQETALGRQPQSDPLTSRHENVLHHVCPCITEASVLRPKGREPMPQRWFIRNACTDPLTGRQPHSCGHHRPDGHVTETVGHIPEFGGHDAETGGPVGPKYATWGCGSVVPCNHRKSLISRWISPLTVSICTKRTITPRLQLGTLLTKPLGACVLSPAANQRT